MKLKKKIVKVGPTVIFSMVLSNRAIAVTGKRQWCYLYFTGSSYCLNKLWGNNDLHNFGGVPKGHSFLLHRRKGNLIIGLPKGSCVLSHTVESDSL